MNEFIQALLNYSFMQHALLACILASIGCGIIGTYVVARRIGFMAGGIAHTVLAGMGIAYYLNGSPLLGALIAALISGILIAWISLRWKQSEDILIAAFWSVGMAIGIIFISRTPGYSVDLMSYLFGNILLISRTDLYLMLCLDIVLIVIVLTFYKQFLATIFDEEFASIRGVNTEYFYILLLTLIALTVVLLIQIVGLILVLALLVLPAASASQFVHTIKRMMLLSVALCLLSTVFGLSLSYQPDLPAGATIIIMTAIIYIVSATIANKIND